MTYMILDSEGSKVQVPGPDQDQDHCSDMEWAQWFTDFT